MSYLEVQESLTLVGHGNGVKLAGGSSWLDGDFVGIRQGRDGELERLQDGYEAAVDGQMDLRIKRRKASCLV
jgi:hypothetical protein